MENVILNVEGMSCNHCVQSVEGALNKLEGVFSTIIDLNEKSVEITYEADKIGPEKLTEVIEDQGYEVI